MWSHGVRRTGSGERRHSASHTAAREEADNQGKSITPYEGGNRAANNCESTETPLTIPPAVCLAPLSVPACLPPPAPDGGRLCVGETEQLRNTAVGIRKGGCTGGGWVCTTYAVGRAGWVGGIIITYHFPCCTFGRHQNKTKCVCTCAHQDFAFARVKYNNCLAKILTS